VKNNLQTAASLLRIQSRRTSSTEVKDAIAQAMRRVEAIAVVHDALSTGLAQTVDFDEVAAQSRRLPPRLRHTGGPSVRPTIEGTFGDLPSEFATPLAIVLTELITNAVEHGLKDVADGRVTVRADRAADHLHVSVSDNGPGSMLRRQLVRDWNPNHSHTCRECSCQRRLNGRGVKQVEPL